MAFHPVNPAILAGGTYSGELIVWNTNESDPQVCSSSIDDYFHREAIMKVEWFLEDVVGEEYNLATVSGDGKVLFWDYKFNQLQYPIRGHTLVNPKKKVVGGRMVAFSQQDPTTFMVGSETGPLAPQLAAQLAAQPTRWDIVTCTHPRALLENGPWLRS